MRILTAVAIVAASTAVAFAQEAKPFGIKPGSQVTDYLYPDELSPEPDTEFSAFSRTIWENGKFDPNEFVLWVKAPDPHPEFEHYYVHQTPETGICLIKAMRTVKPDSNEREPGQTARDLFKKIEAQISSRYGEGEFSESFSLFSYDKNWIKDIGNDDKYYYTKWEPDTSAKDLKLEDIILYIDTFDSAATVNVQYSFSNYDLCRSIHDKTRPEDIEAEASKF